MGKLNEFFASNLIKKKKSLALVNSDVHIACRVYQS